MQIHNFIFAKEDSEFTRELFNYCTGFSEFLICCREFEDESKYTSKNGGQRVQKKRFISPYYIFLSTFGNRLIHFLCILIIVGFCREFDADSESQLGSAQFALENFQIDKYFFGNVYFLRQQLQEAVIFVRMNHNLSGYSAVS